MARGQTDDITYKGVKLNVTGDRCWEYRKRANALGVAWKVLQSIADEADLDVVKKGGHAFVNTRLQEGEVYMFTLSSGKRNEHKVCEHVEGYPAFSMRMVSAELERLGFKERPADIKAKIDAAFVSGPKRS